jgi:hypothetical protein
MKSSEETKALNRRISSANKHWGLFFSDMHNRIIDLSCSRQSTVIVDRSIKNVAANEGRLLSDSENA